jgi:hypothetical protein
MSCPYTSSHNGKAERIIRSINNVIHTLRIQASLLGRYWVEGLHTTTYLLNRLPSKMFRMPVRTSPSLALLRRTSICASLATRVTLILPPLCLTNSPLGPPGVSFLATPLITKAIVALISQQTT